MAELYEVVLVDRGTRWHTGVLADEVTETDQLLAEKGEVLLFGSRAALEHHVQEHRLKLHDDPPDEIDLDLGGWLPHGVPEPSTAEVSELWHLLYDDPLAGRALAGEDLGEAYDDLVEEVGGWFEAHGEAARAALTEAVERLRGRFRRV
ncbi:MAG TPA: hypothetical protein VMZ11_03950 [Mycobacteriales bacterium]|nr:hypothetical protein [Mycobacteriales bacterium]